MERIKKGISSDQRIEKFYQVAFHLVVASLVLPPNFNSWAIILLAVSVVFGPYRKLILPSLFRNKVAWWILSLYILYFIGIFYSINKDYAWAEVTQYKLSLLLLPLIITGFRNFNELFKRRLIRTFYLSILALCMVAVMRSLLDFFGDPSLSLISRLTYEELGSQVGFQPIYMAFYVAFAIFCLIYDVFFDSSMNRRVQTSKWVNFMGFIGTSFLFLVLIMLSSRMEIMVFLFTFGVLALYKAMKEGTWLKTFLVLGASFGVAVVLILSSETNRLRFSEMLDFSSDYTENQYGGRSIRIEKWKNAVECWMKEPLFGVGTGDVKDELMEVYKENEFQIAIDFQFNPHNQYLQTLISIGVPGLIVLLAIFYSLTAEAVKRRHWLIFAFIFVASLSMITESMLERHKGIVFITLFALVFSTRPVENQTANPQFVNE